jgi:hypothetical protein
MFWCAIKDKKWTCERLEFAIEYGYEYGYVYSEEVDI